jgi:hypothetical protein
LVEAEFGCAALVDAGDGHRGWDHESPWVGLAQCYGLISTYFGIKTVSVNGFPFSTWQVMAVKRETAPSGRGDPNFSEQLQSKSPIAWQITGCRSIAVSVG